MRFLLLIFPILLFSKTLTIAAAANVSFALEELIRDYNSQFKVKVKKVIGSSGKLTSQIERGAPYDIFLSADMKYPTYLFKKNRAFTKPVVYAKGKLVLFSKKRIKLKDLNRLKVAIANPKVAPYGKAAMEVLKKLNLHPKLVYAESVAGAYFYAMHAVDAAFLPKSAVINKKGFFIEIPQNLYSPIKQGVVVINPTNEASSFFMYMLSNRALKILKKYGYSD